MISTRAMVSFLGCCLLLGATAGPVRAVDESGRASLMSEFARLSTVRRTHRGALLSLPGVIGVGTEMREDPARVVLTVYVKEETPELRSEIEARLSGEPFEIIVQPDGFRAF